MLIKNWMSKNVVKVEPTASVIKAQILLEDLNISHLPVLGKKESSLLCF